MTTPSARLRFSLLVGSLLAAAPAAALAQPGGTPPGLPPGPPPGPPPPPGPAPMAAPAPAPSPAGYYSPAPTAARPAFVRRGRRLTLGASVGIGGMNSESGTIECSTCEASTVAAGVAFHVGGMITPRLGLMLELQGNMQPVDEAGGTSTTLVQSAALLAAQYFVTPRLWLKGGVGAAQLSFSYDNGVDSESQEIDSGGAFLAGLGYEVLQTPRYSIDLQGRVLIGSYDGIGEQITAGHVGVGFNWY